MKLLGIDYGRKKVGLAVSEGVIAEPWKVLRIKNLESGIENILQIIKTEQIRKVVIGVSEGGIGGETKEFSRSLSSSLRKYNIEIIEWDETFSTQHAQRLSIEAGIKRKKRKEMEDAYSAALILQSYIDTL